MQDTPGSGIRILRRKPYSAPATRNVDHFLGAVIFSPNARVRGTIAAVALCEHRHLCTGVQLTVEWSDGLITHHCSDDVVALPDTRFQLRDE